MFMHEHIPDLTTDWHPQSTGAPQCHPILWNSHWTASIHGILHHHRFAECITHPFCAILQHLNAPISATTWFITKLSRAFSINTTYMAMWKRFTPILHLMNDWYDSFLKYHESAVFSRVCRERFHLWLYSSKATGTHTDHELAVGQTSGKRCLSVDGFCAMFLLYCSCITCLIMLKVSTPPYLDLQWTPLLNVDSWSYTTV